jgi:ankyrin repeat protein
MGPDLDVLSTIVVCAMGAKDAAALRELIGQGDSEMPCRALLRPSATALGCVLSHDLVGLKERYSAPDDLACVDTAGHSLLHYAAARDDDACLSLLAWLLQQPGQGALGKADLVKGSRPIHVAANNGASRAAKMLCMAERSAGVSQAETLLSASKRSSDGLLALHVAATRGNLDCMCVLQQYASAGAESDITPKLALHMSLLSDPVVVELLFRYKKLPVFHTLLDASANQDVLLLEEVCN